MQTAMPDHNPRVVRFRTERELRQEMESIGCHEAGIEIMLGRGQAYLVRLEQVPFTVANSVKQAFLARGGDAVVHQGLYFGLDRTTDMLLIGTWEQFQAALRRLRAQPAQAVRDLADDVARVLADYRSWPPPPMPAGNTIFEWGTRTYVMGIINVTPDSFSGDGIGTDIGAAVRLARAFVAAGASILDIGGESTRPGSEPISADEEMERVLPAIRAIAAETDVALSIDTYKAQVAAAALDAGADIVNDVWGLRMDPEMAPLVAARGVPVIIMHNRSRPRDAVQEERLGGRYVGVEYADLMGDIVRELRAGIRLAVSAGVDPARIIVDPGIGFGKTVQQNLTLIDRLDQLRSLGRPILVGPSRKSFIGFTLDAPPDRRLPGTAATVALAIVRGADIVRVHDVAELADVVRMTDAIVRRAT